MFVPTLIRLSIAQSSKHLSTPTVTYSSSPNAFLTECMPACMWTLVWKYSQCYTNIDNDINFELAYVRLESIYDLRAVFVMKHYQLYIVILKTKLSPLFQNFCKIKLYNNTKSPSNIYTLDINRNCNNNQNNYQKLTM